MKFELNEYKRELSDDEILNDIKSVANKLNVDYIAISTYKKYGKYSQTAIQGHFGTWKNALLKAGLRNERTPSELKFISDEEYFTDLRRVAKIIARNTVPYDDYKKHGYYSAEYIFKRFGKWNDVLKKAGLEGTGFSKDKITEQQCFDEIERMWIQLGRQPTSTDIIKNGISIYSIDSFNRRFGGWRKALEAFIEYINASKNQEEFYSKKSDTKENKQVDNLENNENKYKPSVESKKTGHRTSRSINTRLRFLVLKRDNFKCCVCGASPAKDPSVVLQVDHIIPWAKGGETDEDNLQTLCSRCNLGKSDLL